MYHDFTVSLCCVDRFVLKVEIEMKNTVHVCVCTHTGTQFVQNLTLIFKSGKSERILK